MLRTPNYELGKKDRQRQKKCRRYVNDNENRATVFSYHVGEPPYIAKSYRRAGKGEDGA